MPQPGTLIEGKYEILGKIREGGMGTIYKVRHRLLDEIRVVKVMKPSITADEELKRRFLEEAKMATRLKHPNIGAIHDFALDEDGTAYLVMEFIDGANLVELLRSKGPPELPLVLEIAHQSLLALGYLHRRNVIHRDVAPDNLMLSQDEEGNPQVKLIDLGIAKALDRPVDLTSTGVFLGKLKYASPEQYGALNSGERLDGRSDLYCLGVVIYELLTDSRPFVGETPAELLRAHLFSPPTPFEQTDPDGRVPQDVRALVMKALSKKREDRFASAEEFDREVLALRQQHGTVPGFEQTVQMISRARDSSGVTKAQTVTPSAQNRLDRQFASGSTPSARRTEIPSLAGGEQATEVAPGPSGRQNRRSLLWIAAVAAALAVAWLLLDRPWKGRPESTAAAPLPPPTPLAVASREDVQPTAAPPTAAPTSVPTAVAENPQPAAPAAAASDAERAEAQRARQRAERARASAERSNAPARSSAVFRDGRKAQEEGERLLARKDFRAASSAFERSTDRYLTAQSQASAPPVAQALPTGEPPVPTSRPALSPTEPARVAVLPTSPPEPSAVAAVEHRASDSDKIRDAVRRYEKAQSTLDADLYASVYPQIDKERIRTAFADLRTQSVEFAIQKIEISPAGNSATVRGYETRTAVPRIGSEQHFSGSRVIYLEKRGDAWIITRLGT